MNETLHLVTYNDLYMGCVRTRVFPDLDEALKFIKMRAIMPEMYNEFKLSIQVENEEVKE